jgi:wyosine [tRNA(Phe)-imidazoG37] synthetase (radical SAM superfamily)
MFVDSGKCQQYHLDNEINAPIANLDLEDWLDFITSTTNNNEQINKETHLIDTTNDEKTTKSRSSSITRDTNSNLHESIDLCSSLEDLVKTFDKNVKDRFMVF